MALQVRKAAAVAGAVLALGGAWAGTAPEAQAAGCVPRVTSYGPTIGYSHNGSRIFSRTVDVYNPCSDTTWRMDIRPLTADRNINPATGRTTTYPISSSWGPPYVAGFKAR